MHSPLSEVNLSPHDTYVLARVLVGLEWRDLPCSPLTRLLLSHVNISVPDDLAALRRRTSVPIAADEAIRRAPDPVAAVRSVTRRQAADVVVVKCAPLGGVRAALRVAEAAELPCVVSSALETSVGLAAQLALAGALPSLDHACGLGTVRLLTGDLVPAQASLVPADGFLPVPRTPPAPDAGLLDWWAQPEPDRVRWWVERLRRVARLLARPTTGI